MKPSWNAAFQRSREERRARSVERWTEYRKLGYWRYVVEYGLLRYGVALIVIWTAVFRLEEGKWPSGEGLLALVGTCLLFGYLYGWVSWNMYARRVEK